MKTEKHKAKQHSFYRLKTHFLFAKLIEKRISTLSDGTWKKYEELTPLLSKLQMVVSEYEEKRQKIETEIKTLEWSHKVKSEKLEKLILEELLRKPKEDRNKEKVDILVQQYDKAKDEFEREIESLKTSLKKEIAFYQPSVLELEQIKSQRLELAVYGRNHSNVEYIFPTYLGIHQNNVRQFLNGTFHFRIGHIKVRINRPELQLLSVIKLSKLFPQWNLKRIIYFIIFSELISLDDYFGLEREYKMGYATEILEEILEGESVWTRPSEIHKEKWNSLTSDAIEKLDKWLSNSMELETLITDPFVLAYAEVDALQYEKKHYEFIFKGGKSFVNQIMEFVLFAKTMSIELNKSG